MRNRLYRSRSDRMLFGVAGGMADWFDLDPSLVRLVWALLVVAGGVGLVLYVIAAIVIPEEPLGAAGPAEGAAATAAAAGPPTAGATPGADDWEARRQARRAARAQRGNSGGIVLGLILIALGAWFLIDRFLNIDAAIVVPGILIVLGAALLLGSVNRR